MSTTNSEAGTTLDPYFSFLYGGIAGSVAKTVIAPFDRIKIHFQIAHPELSQYKGKSEKNSVWLL